MLTRLMICSVLACRVFSAEYVGAQTLAELSGPSEPLDIVATDPPPPVPVREERPPVLVPLYLSLVGLQAADGLLTLKAIRHHDGRELNPAMRRFAGRKPSLFLIKTSSTAATVLAAEKLWRRNRAAAVLTMIGINVAYGAVVAHNVRQLR